MSDGEGLERIWSELCDLVAVLRYSTKEHRLWALHLQAVFYNERGRLNSGIGFDKSITCTLALAEINLNFCSVESMIRRMKDMKKLLIETPNKLTELLHDPNYTVDYIKEQWDRQRECQLKVIGSDSIKALTEKVAHLVDLEENLHESQSVSMV